MKNLPNGLRVFNATPHPISFWSEGWAGVEVVESDEVINASIQEQEHSTVFAVEYGDDGSVNNNVWLVCTSFVGNTAGRQIIARAKEAGAHVIVGSIIAAQAYPGQVVAMTPAPGYERVAPAEKRMNPDKFTVYPPY